MENNAFFSSVSMLPIEDGQTLRVWFATRELCFACHTIEGYYTLCIASPQDISRAKIITFLENYNKVVVLSEEPLRAFECFARQMKCVEAAGGVVQSELGEVVMIRRNERWDLPKGHREKGETMEQCAAREAEEETGVKARVLRPLCETTHAYYFPRTERWELKCTHWYLLRSTESGDLKPQTEEGIVGVEWCNPIEVDRYLEESYPTIRRVVEALRSVVRR